MTRIAIYIDVLLLPLYTIALVALYLWILLLSAIAIAFAAAAGILDAIRARLLEKAHSSYEEN